MATTLTPSSANTRISINKIAADNIINSAESKSNVTITGTVSGVYKVGDPVTLTVNGVTYRGKVASNGMYSIIVKGSDLAADSDRIIDVSLEAHNSLGATATISNSQQYNVDLGGINSSTTSIKFNPITADNIVNTSESSSQVPITGTVSGEFSTGDTLTLKIASGTYTGKVLADGSFKITVKGSDLAIDTDTTIEATLTSRDASGNTASIIVNKTYTVDTKGPDSNSSSILLDPISSDNIINPTEASGQINITGTIKGDYNAGDKITVRANGIDYTGTVYADGKFSVPVNGKDLLSDGDKTIEVSALVKDSAGNQGTVTSNLKYLVDATTPGITSISNPSVTEGSDAVFTVKVSPSQAIQAVDFQIGNGSLTNAEYGTPKFSNGVTVDSTTGKLIIPANVTEFNVSVPTLDDSEIEGTETLSLFIDKAVGTASILDNDSTASPTKVSSISSASSEEGSALNFIVSLTSASKLAQTLDFAMTGATASSSDYGIAKFSQGVTYDAATGKLNIPAGVASFTVNIATNDDSQLEASETLSIRIGGVEAIGTIIDNDTNTAQITSIDNKQITSINEGQSLTYVVTTELSNTTTYANFKVFGSGINSSDLAPPTFTNGVTYDVNTGKISIPAGTTQFNIQINTLDDKDVEATENLTLALGTKSVTTALLDNDFAPVGSNIQSVTNGFSSEGSSISFGVKLTTASSLAQEYALSLKGTAAATDYQNLTFSNGVTYNATTGKISVPAGVSAFTINLDTVDDQILEQTEEIELNLGGKLALGKIYDNDAGIIASVSSPGATEGYQMTYEVSLSKEYTTPQTVEFHLGGGSASAEDYGTPTFTNGVTWDSVKSTLTIPTGVTQFNINLPTIDEKLYEGQEFVPIIVGGINGRGTIVESQSRPEIAEISDPSTTEGADITFAVKLTATLGVAQVFELNYQSGSAIFSQDFDSIRFTNGVQLDEYNRLMVPAGVSSFDVIFRTIDDSIAQGEKTIGLTIGRADTEVPRFVTGTGTISDNDSGGSVSIALNPIAGDKVINVAESQQDIPVSGTVTGKFVAGDLVTININGVSYTTPVDASGKFTVAVPSRELIADTDKVFEASIDSHDNAGNLYHAETSQAYGVDITAPDAPKVPNQSTNNLLPTITGTAEPNLTVTVEVNGAKYEVRSDSAGNWKLDTSSAIPIQGKLNPFEAGKVYDVTAIAIDQNGNQSPADSTSGELTILGGSPIGAVTDTNQSANKVYNNVAQGAQVGITAKASDPDSADTVTYSLTNNASGRFTINSKTGVVTTARGFTSADSGDHSIQIKATSSDGSTSSRNDIVHVATPTYVNTDVVSGMSAALGWAGHQIGHSVSRSFEVVAGSYYSGNVSAWVQNNTQDGRATYGGHWEVRSQSGQIVSSGDFQLGLGQSGSWGIGFTATANETYTLSISNPWANSTGASGWFWSKPWYWPLENSDLNVSATLYGANRAYQSDPLVLDLNGDGVKTLSYENGVKFDVNGTGQATKTGWVDQHDGLLVIDKNHNGSIDDGTELFGNSTKLADGSNAQNGFQALATYDTNHDQVIDQKDDAFNQIKVWRDANSDGVSGSDELMTLGELGIAAINLAAQASTHMDNGNQIAAISNYRTVDGSVHELVDVWFTSDGAATKAVTESSHGAHPETSEPTSDPSSHTPLGLHTFLHTPYSLENLLSQAGLSEVHATPNTDSPYQPEFSYESMKIDAHGLDAHEILKSKLI